MKFFRLARKLKNEEEGAVTVDWVVLTAAVVVLAAIVMSVIKSKVGGLSTSIGSYLDGAASAVSSASSSMNE